jgi:hypothetical protein
MRQLRRLLAPAIAPDDGQLSLYGPAKNEALAFAALQCNIPVHVQKSGAPQEGLRAHMFRYERRRLVLNATRRAKSPLLGPR